MDLCSFSIPTAPVSCGHRCLAGNDALYGYGGNDLVDGGGNDVLVGGAGADRLLCGNGIDTASTRVQQRVSLQVLPTLWSTRVTARATPIRP
nr:hypothetical protein [uncultured Shinella sp.]